MIQTHHVVPFTVQSGWLPHPRKKSFQTFIQSILNKEPKRLSPAIQALKTLIETNPVLSYLIANACQQNANIVYALQSSKEAPIPGIRDLENF